MDIQNKTVLVLGGWGLVGSAICRNFVEEKPKRLIVASMKREEAEEAVSQLRKEFPRAGRRFFVPWWGNIFVRHELKDMRREDILASERYRAMLIEDIVEELTEPILRRSALFKLLDEFKPEIIVDCINSATAIAYQDIFQAARGVLKEISHARRGNNAQKLIEVTERLLCTLYVPQIVRHVQTLYRSMNACGTKIYVKIGTSGTGGM
jgi:NAD(P)-dependent dehydrogenase (short-subunit alcohol dehydrogenase family)